MTAPSGRTVALLAIGALCALIATFFALVHVDAAFVDGRFVPRSNDAFYHARRILDAALGRGFYEFDPRLHVPEGTWIPWPWGFDLLIAEALKLYLWLRPATPPTTFIAYVPVAFAALNGALFVAAAAQTGLRASLVLPAALGLALLPLSQIMHSVGTIDHHFIEFTFVLLANWLGLRWFAAPGSRARAAVFGIALGTAVAFHNGLFVLQIPLLACCFALWLRDARPPRRATLWLCAALLASTALVALPSSAFRSLLFEFSLLSWFHVYIALCSSVVLLFMAWTSPGARSVGVLATVSLLLALPILSQALQGASFVSGEMQHLDSISEVWSPLRMFTQAYGPVQTASFYSWLIVAAPLMLGLFAWRAFRETRPPLLYFALWSTFGLALLLMQYRLHYFGLLAMLVGPCLALQALAQRGQWRPGMAVLIAVGVITLTFQPALRGRLFVIYSPAGDPTYAETLELFDALAAQCDDEPGLVLASNDDGSPILFHTECSVISNNFIMTQADAAALGRITALMTGTPQDILAHEPAIRYVLLRAPDFVVTEDAGSGHRLDPRNAVATALLGTAPVPPGFRTVHTAYRKADADGPREILGRLLEVGAAATP